MTLLTRIVFVFGAIGTVAAFLFRARSLKQDAEIAQEEADQAHEQQQQTAATLKASQQLATARDQLRAQHQQEKQTDDQALAADRRDHFDNTW